MCDVCNILNNYKHRTDIEICSDINVYFKFEKRYDTVKNWVNFKTNYQMKYCPECGCKIKK